jgi:hypothetical protein
MCATRFPSPMSAACQNCRSLTKPVGANLAVCGRCDRLQVIPQEPVERPWLSTRRL